MSVSGQEFRNVLAHWASGVTVVTTVADGAPIGITASSLTSVSIDPPQVLICVGRRLFTHAAILNSGVFAANILGAEHLEWGRRFAGLVPESGDRFHDIAWTKAVTGSAILPGVLAWVDCRVRHTYDGDDHSIIVGEVVAAGVLGGAAPLLYFNRNWRQLSDLPLEPAVSQA